MVTKLALMYLTQQQQNILIYMCLGPHFFFFSVTFVFSFVVGGGVGFF